MDRFSDLNLRMMFDEMGIDKRDVSATTGEESGREKSTDGSDDTEAGTAR